MNQLIITSIQSYLEGETLSAEQTALLQQWRQASPHNEQAWQQLQDKSFVTAAIQQTEVYIAGKENNWEKLTQLLAQQQADLLNMDDKPVATAPVVTMRKSRRTYIAAAAVILLGLGFFGWWSMRTAKPDRGSVTTTQQPDILPGHQGAVLTLADGSTKLLDSMGNGVIADQNGTSVKLENGQIAYDASKSQQVQYNTMTTPRGRMFKIVLPDGTQVWLNAASSITYPTAFTGKQRKVSVTGEVYFEVAKNKAMPFIVTTKQQGEVEVLGTHFNINAYEDEAGMQTTLLEGKVKVSGAGQTAMLQPGQQAQWNASSQAANALQVSMLSADKIAQVMAWKNGIFNFEDQTLEQVMKQVARWYDIDIKYANGIPNIEFFGEMGRDVNLSQILHFLERSGVKCTLEAERKQLTVL